MGSQRVGHDLVTNTKAIGNLNDNVTRFSNVSHIFFLLLAGLGPCCGVWLLHCSVKGSSSLVCGLPLLWECGLQEFQGSDSLGLAPGLSFPGSCGILVH